jgi:omega-6 fatty acid desaturase (delta-12 desaturase)
VQYRLPANLYRAGWRYWASALGTNLFIAGVVGTLVWGFGWAAILAIYLPTSVVAGAAGFWLFFVQHQFEETLWEREADWTVQEAALHGSSYYVLPAPLRWLTANIGMHHIHHLAARTPFYRLPQILREHPELDACQRLTLRESLRCARLHLWDEERRLLVPFSSADSGRAATSSRRR